MSLNISTLTEVENVTSLNEVISQNLETSNTSSLTGCPALTNSTCECPTTSPLDYSQITNTNITTIVNTTCENVRTGITHVVQQNNCVCIFILKCLYFVSILIVLSNDQGNGICGCSHCTSHSASDSGVRNSGI